MEQICDNTLYKLKLQKPEIVLTDVSYGIDEPEDLYTEMRLNIDFMKKKIQIEEEEWDRLENIVDNNKPIEQIKSITFLKSKQKIDEFCVWLYSKSQEEFAIYELDSIRTKKLYEYDDWKTYPYTTYEKQIKLKEYHTERLEKINKRIAELSQNQK